MITSTDFVAIHFKGSPTQGAAIERARGEAWIERCPYPERWELVPVVTCSCCGIPAWDNGRCTKHQGRNPCAVEGCTRTRAVPAGGALANDQTICGEHWKRYVPPRSRTRRAYHLFFRQAKQHGWGYKGKRGKSARLDWRFDRFWGKLIRMVRRRADGGHLDEAAINRLMGWDDGG
jgi:hypothetical protein